MTPVPGPPRTFLVPPVETVAFGAGAFDTVASAVEQVGGTRVLVVLSGSLACGEREAALRDRLGGLLVATYSRTAQHVPRTSVLEALATARKVGADCLVSLGGGTPIDCAKAVALGLATGITQPEHFEKYRVRFTYPATYDVPAVDGDVVPHIAIPTTLSGGEHTGLCGITDPATLTKEVFSSPALQPRRVILDPWVSAETPDWLWAASGIRAVDHAVEGMLSTRHLPMTDALGSTALRLLDRHLAHSSRHPEDEEARTNCMVAAWLSIFGSATVGVGLSHGIGHQLAAAFDMIHGVTSAIMLPRVMEFVREQTLPRQRLVAEAFGVDTRDLTDLDAAASAAAAVRDLVRACGVPEAISAAGGRLDRLDKVADRVMHDATVATSPRPVTRDDILDLLRSAW